MRTPTAATILAAICSLAVQAGAAEAAFAQKPTVTKAGDKVRIDFSVAAATDVEVSVLDAGGKVACHLAAGVLGAKDAPPAPLKAGLAQSLEWDGRDDYGEVVKGGPFKVRVRAGLGVKLEKIVGGDPYEYFSMEVGQDNHAGWFFTGLEAKKDGSVYLFGSLNFYGPAAVRCYDAEGNYKRTVYPPPAGKPAEAMTGWGTFPCEDGSYAFRHENLDASTLSDTGITSGRALVAPLLPNPDEGKLHFLAARNWKLIEVNTDGTIPADPGARGQLVNAPPMVFDDKAGWLRGNPFVAPAPDGKHFYLAGVFADTGISYRRGKEVQTSGFWRDGQVYRVDAATRKAEVFFALDEKSIVADLGKRGAAIGDSVTTACASLHGLAVDRAGRVFVCDRLNKRVLVLDPAGKPVREIAVEAPDAIALDPDSKALYVTSRKGHYHGRDKDFRVLKFADWEKDAKPAVETVITPHQPVGLYRGRTHLALVKSGNRKLLWVAFVALPVHIYEDRGNGLALVKDFYEVGAQRAVDMEHMAVDPRTEAVYVHGGFGNLFGLEDWSKPELRHCRIEGEKSGGHAMGTALGFAIDPRREFFYLRQDRRPVRRYRLNGGRFVPAPIGNGGGDAITPPTSNDWRINLGFGERGLAVAPDGGLAALVSFGKNDYSGPLSWFRPDGQKAPWEGLPFKQVGDHPKTAGVKFDPRGNMYVGLSYDKPIALPGELDKQGQLKGSLGRIIRFAPTGSLKAGNLYPSEPEKPTKTYNVPYGSIDRDFARASFFGVDGWGRIYYPTSLLCRFTVMDNEGNEILRCGTYGNRDSLGGLDGDLVPTKDIPMAYPNCVDVTDDYVYVSDIVNVRLMRLAKTFAAAETIGIE